MSRALKKTAMTQTKVGKVSSAAARQRLIEVGKRLLTDSHSALVSDDIEREAGLPPGTFKQRFPSGAAYVEAVTAAIKRDMKSRLVVQSAITPAPEQATSRRQLTRSALIEAGKRLMSNGHLDSSSIDDIVQEAGVAKGSFFNHFTNRSELVVAVLSTVQQQLETHIKAGLVGKASSADRVTRGTLTALRYGLENQLGAHAMTRVTVHAVNPDVPVNMLLRQQLKVGIETHEFQIQDVDAGMVVVLGVVELGLARLLEVRSDPRHVDRLLRELCSTLLYAMGVDAKRHATIVDEGMQAVFTGYPK